MMDWLRHDVAHAVRSLARRPGYTALVVFALALGLGANMAAFSVVNALLFRSSRTPDATRIGALWEAPDGTPLGIEARADLPWPLLPGDAAEGILRIATPRTPGTFTLRAAPVRDGAPWFDTVDPRRGRRIPVRVVEE